MALGYSSSLRTSRLTAVKDAIDAGAGPALIRLYDGTRPSNGGSPTTLLAEGTFSDPCSVGPVGDTLTMSAITSDAAADNNGTATWFRVVTSAGTFVMDGTIGVDATMNSPTIVAGQEVQFPSFVITAGNQGVP